MVMSAVLWSLQTVRLGRHARSCEPLTLAQHQTATFALLSALWLASSYVAVEGPSPVGSLLGNGTAFLTWAAVLWPAVGPWGIGTALQVGTERACGTLLASESWVAAEFRVSSRVCEPIALAAKRGQRTQSAGSSHTSVTIACWSSPCRRNSSAAVLVMRPLI